MEKDQDRTRTIQEPGTTLAGRGRRFSRIFFAACQHFPCRRVEIFERQWKFSWNAPFREDARITHLMLYLFCEHIIVDSVVRTNVRKCQAVPRLNWAGPEIRWRAQGADFRTFLGDFVATLPPVNFPRANHLFTPMSSPENQQGLHRGSPVS